MELMSAACMQASGHSRAAPQDHHDNQIPYSHIIVISFSLFGRGARCPSEGLRSNIIAEYKQGPVCKRRQAPAGPPQEARKHVRLLLRMGKTELPWPRFMISELCANQHVDSHARCTSYGRSWGRRRGKLRRRGNRVDAPVSVMMTPKNHADIAWNEYQRSLGRSPSCSMKFFEEIPVMCHDGLVL